MNHPVFLQRTARERIELLTSRRFVDLPKACVTFDPWGGESPKTRYGGKALLDWKGELVFAELAILRAFQSAGWDGCWVDTYGGKYRVGYWGDAVVRDIPTKAAGLLRRIQVSSGQRSGCFDVFCWKDEEVRFAEAKRKGRDRIRDTQRRWLEAALGVGLSTEDFLVVEWSIA